MRSGSMSRCLMLLFLAGMVSACQTTKETGSEAPQGPANSAFIGLSDYIKAEGLGPPENMGYVSARCASLNSITAVVQRNQGNDEAYEVFNERSIIWIDAARRIHADALKLGETAPEVVAQVRDEMSHSRENYMSRLVDSAAADSPAGDEFFKNDMQVCEYLREAFNLKA